MHGQDQLGVFNYLSYIQHLTSNVTRFGHCFIAVERKSLSLYQYCRYPANSMNRLNLEPPGSRDFRFCRGALRLISM